MIKRIIRPSYDVLQAPFIKVDAQVIQNGTTNGKNNINKKRDEYLIAPSAKKIATYITNQIFGSDLLIKSTTEDTNVGWLTPSLQEALTNAIYQCESFVYIHIYDEKVYLQCFEKSDLHNLVQKFDKIISCEIHEDFITDEGNYRLIREIKLEKDTTLMKMKAFEVTPDGKEEPIGIELFNSRTGSDYIANYILPYEVLINIDIGKDFFKDSRTLLNAEMEVFNTIGEEIEKTKTRLATSQHYQSSDLVTSWTPGGTTFNPQIITVKKLQDFFTLLPGDKDHHFFEFLQGDLRIDEYITTFKFYDYQIIQMAGLSPSSFGYEKDAYMNTANVDVSKNASDMTVEGIKTQITPQVNKLFKNILLAQQHSSIIENVIPNQLEWDYGLNEKFDDMKKLQVMRSIQGVASIPMTHKAKIVMPILNKLIDGQFDENDENITAFIDDWKKENREITDIRFGEL